MDIVNIGLAEMGIQNVAVFIRPIPPKLKEHHRRHNVSLDGFITGGGNRYIIWVDKLSIFRTITVLSHELIHLEQYRTKKIVYLGGQTVMWNGRKYRNILSIPYYERPWEIEAHKRGRILRAKIIEKLKR